jgi:hypothetical protein
MDIPRTTDERLRFALNSDQPSRERLCVAILSLDRNYSNIEPRRPEGGPDGGRDIQCKRGPDECYGAVGFINSVSDSTKNKREIKKKFNHDLAVALEQKQDLKAFVFFTNVDLTPAEVDNLKKSAYDRGVSFVDIYWRERIRQALDSPEGLAFRFQYLNLPLSEAEQASFFSRFGKEIENLFLGRFDRLEKKIEFIEFLRWQSGKIRKVELKISYKNIEESKRCNPDHFRVCLELQSVVHEKRSIILGGQDDYWDAGNGDCYLGTKTFFFRQHYGEIQDSWIPNGPRVGGGYVQELNFGVRWLPISEILAAEFDHLGLNFHFTENLLDRIARVKFSIDSYVFVDSKLQFGSIDFVGPSLGWPNPLTEMQQKQKWRYCNFGWISFDKLPKSKEQSDF